MMLDTILIIGAALSVFLIVVGLYQVFFNPRLAVVNRLGKATAEIGGPAGQGVSKRSLREDLLWVLGKLGRIAPRRVRLEEIQANLIKAHIFMRAEEFLGLTLVVGAAAYLIIYLMTKSAIIGFLAGLISIFLPGLIVNSKKKKRSMAMTNQLPEALNIISSGLRAGFSFPQAVSIVVREMEPPLAYEFSRVLRENRIGKPMDEALNDLLERVENDDLELLITALLIQRQVGGNLAEVLDGISHTIRERVRIKGEIRTLTAEGRMSGIILSILPLAAAGGFFLLNPDYIAILFREAIGIALVVAAVILQIIGIFIIRKIVNIDI
jgi:tight adherence protein B